MAGFVGVVGFTPIPDIILRKIEGDFRGLKWSFGILVLSAIAFVYVAQLGDKPEAAQTLSALLVLSIFASWIAFYVFLANLAIRLKRSVVVWVGLTFLTQPLGPIYAFTRMSDLVQQALRANRASS